MAAIFSSVSSSQRTPGPGPPAHAAVDDPCRGDDQVQPEVVVGDGDALVLDDLHVMHRRHHHGVRADQSRLTEDPVLEVAVAAALAQAGAARRDRHAAGDHQVEGVHLLDRRRAPVGAGALDGRRLAGPDGELLGPQGEEGLVGLQPGNRHVERLALLDDLLAGRQLG
jgi:hypothetical protein